MTALNNFEVKTMVIENEYADASIVQHAASLDLITLGERLSAHDVLTEQDTQTVLARLQIAQIALTLPGASLGSCATDGTPLTFRGRDDGLYICCNLVCIFRSGRV